MPMRFLTAIICLACAAATSVLPLTTFENTAHAQAAPSAVEQAVLPLRHYYAAINQKNYAAAFAIWEKREDGKAVNGQSFAAFAGGFSDTAYVNLEIGEPGEIEGAAGSNFVEIPVVISAMSTAGQQQRFAGSYTMRSSNIAEDRNWHIYSAKVKKIE